MNLPQLITDSALVIGFTMGLSKAVTSALTIKDNWAYLLTILIGLVLTGLMDYAAFVPTSVPQWIYIGLHGLGVGLSGCGLYKLPMAMAGRK